MKNSSSNVDPNADLDLNLTLASADWFRRIVASEVSKQLSTARLVVGVEMTTPTLVSTRMPRQRGRRGPGRPKKQVIIDSPVGDGTGAKSGSKPKQTLSKAGRLAIIAAQRKRWAKIKREEKAKAKEAVKVEVEKPVTKTKVAKAPKKVAVAKTKTKGKAKVVKTPAPVAAA
jgi:hypothetical protein